MTWPCQLSRAPPLRSARDVVPWTPVPQNLRLEHHCQRQQQGVCEGCCIIGPTFQVLCLAIALILR